MRAASGVVISIHDRPAIERKLIDQLTTIPSAIPRALMLAQRKYARFMGNQNKYVPHQGEREIARRLKQGEAQ